MLQCMEKLEVLMQTSLPPSPVPSDEGDPASANSTATTNSNASTPLPPTSTASAAAVDPNGAGGGGLKSADYPHLALKTLFPDTDKPGNEHSRPILNSLIARSELS